MSEFAKNVEAKFTMVTDATEGVGTSTWWALSGNVALDRLTAAWKAAGLPSEWLVEKPSAEVALRRAIDELTDDQSKAEMLKTTREWVLSAREEIDGFPRYTPLAKWKLDDNDKPVSTFAVDDGELDMVLQHTFTESLQTITSQDVSQWLKWLAVDRFDGVLLRENGGIYYVPPMHAATWRAVQQVVGATTANSITALPMLKNEHAVETILAALVERAKLESEKFIDALAAHNDGTGTKGHRALTTQAENAKALHTKMVRYAQMLGTAVPSIADSIEKLSAGLFAASAAVERGDV